MLPLQQIKVNDNRGFGGFSVGGTTTWRVLLEGNRHDYQYTWEYVYNGLQCLFSWYEGSMTQ